MTNREPNEDETVDESIDGLRQLRQLRIDQEGESEFTDALAYIAELLEALDDVEALIDERVSDYEEQLDRAYQRDVAKLHRKLTERQTDAVEAVVQRELDEMQTTASEAKEDATDAQRDVRSLRTTINSYFQRVQDRFDSVETRLETVDESETEQEDPVQIASLEKRLTTMNTELTQLKGRVEDVQKTIPQETETFAPDARRVERLERDLARLRDSDEVSDVAWMVLRSGLDSMKETTEATSASQQDAVPSMKPETRIHRSLVALAAYDWMAPDDWVTAGELQEHSAIPTNSMSRTDLSKLLATLHRKHGVADRRKTDAPNATYEYRIRPSGKYALEELGVPSFVSPDEFAQYIQTEPTEQEVVNSA